MRVDLTEQEAEQLRSALENYLGDLRYEIANTDLSAFKDELRTKRALLESVAAKLQPEQHTITA